MASTLLFAISARIPVCALASGQDVYTWESGLMYLEWSLKINIVIVLLVYTSLFFTIKIGLRLLFAATVIFNLGLFVSL
jgi:hypothetical protein